MSLCFNIRLALGHVISLSLAAMFISIYATVTNTCSPVGRHKIEFYEREVDSLATAFQPGSAAETWCIHWQVVDGPMGQEPEARYGLSVC